MRDELGLAVDQAFREAGIRIPFAQSDVHLHFPEGQLPRIAPAAVPKVGYLPVRRRGRFTSKRLPDRASRSPAARGIMR